MTEPKTEISKVIKPDQIGYFDNLLGMLKLEDGEKKLEDFLREDFRENFENNLKNYILRYKELGSVFATKDSNSRYMQFLDETRQIYVQGQYIACIIMCGATAERIFKDKFSSCLRIYDKGNYNELSDKSIGEIEQFPEKQIVIFLRDAGLIEKTTSKAGEDLAELRNKYVHANVSIIEEDQQEAAKTALKKLKIIIDDTISYKAWLNK